PPESTRVGETFWRRQGLWSWVHGARVTASLTVAAFRHIRARRPGDLNLSTLQDAGVENVNAPGRRIDHHGCPAPCAGLYGAAVLQLHDRGVVAVSQDRMNRLVPFVTW